MSGRAHIRIVKCLTSLRVGISQFNMLNNADEVGIILALLHLKKEVYYGASAI